MTGVIATEKKVWKTKDGQEIEVEIATTHEEAMSNLSQTFGSKEWERQLKALQEASKTNTEKTAE